MASFVETHGHAADEGNFEALYETYKSDVQRLASYLLRNATDAEDAAQTVFVNVLRALRQGVTPSDPRAWLLAITRNVCFSRHRAAAARPDHVELDLETAAHPSEDVGPTAEEIVGALARMRPNQRTALILRDFRGVSRSEISDLMSLSAVSVEALLTRARASFREELEAGDQPFECVETRTLVEQQLDGLITVADRHSLRSHLRHCTPCSSLARAVRSTRGKLAGVIFWPVDLISRLVSAFSQAPGVVHVAAAITSTAAVATVAIPVAITNGPASTHVEGRAALGPALVVSPQASRAATPIAGAIRVVSHKAAHHAAATHKAHAAKSTAHAVSKTAPTAKASPAPVTASSAPPATTGSLQMPGQQPSPASANQAAPSAPQSMTLAPRSNSPAARPQAKPRPKPVRKASRRKSSGRHSSAPPDRMPTSSPPADNMPSGGNGATGGAGPGFMPGAVVSPAIVPSAAAGQNNAPDTGAKSTTAGHGKHHR